MLSNYVLRKIPKVQHSCHLGLSFLGTQGLFPSPSSLPSGFVHPHRLLCTIFPYRSHLFRQVFIVLVAI